MTLPRRLQLPAPSGTVSVPVILRAPLPLAGPCTVPLRIEEVVREMVLKSPGLRDPPFSVRLVTVTVARLPLAPTGAIDPELIDADVKLVVDPAAGATLPPSKIAMVRLLLSVVPFRTSVPDWKSMGDVLVRPFHVSVAPELKVRVRSGSSPVMHPR